MQKISGFLCIYCRAVSRCRIYWQTRGFESKYADFSEYFLPFTNIFVIFVPTIGVIPVLPFALHTMGDRLNLISLLPKNVLVY